MQVDLLIVGQGLCGSWLSQEGRQLGLSVCVIDAVNSRAASRLSAGIINPITGRRHVEVWLADEIMAYAPIAYGEMEKRLGHPLIRRTTLIDFFPSDQMRDSFRTRMQQQGKYVHSTYSSLTNTLPFHDEFGAGVVEPVYLIDLPAFLKGQRNTLRSDQVLLEETIDPSHLRIDARGVQYQDIRAERIIFCDGAATLSQHYFPNLPYAPNKGEVLILDIPGLPKDHLYKHGVLLAPLADGTWWAGSSYQWSFEHPYPTEAFREQTENTLRNWLQIPFTVVDHRAGIRPATLERRPFVGFHPEKERVGILNGMGTKGCSLAPFFARQLVRNWVYGEPIQPEAWVGRFQPGP